MAYLSYFQIYAMYWFSIILFFFPGVMTLKTFAIIIAVISALLIGKRIFQDGMKISSQFALTGLLFLIIIGIYGLVIPSKYNHMRVTDTFSGEYLALTGQTFPAVLTALIVGKDAVCQEQMKQFSLITGLFFSVIALLSAINPTGAMTSGLAETTNNLNYQTLSYMSAYGSGMLLYYLICFHKKGNTSKDRIISGLCFLGVIINLFTILLSGGRGGVVDYIALVAVSLFLYNKKPGNKKNRLINFIALVLITFTGVIIVIHFAAQSNLQTSGYMRIVNFFRGTGDTIRTSLYSKAIESFLRSPIFGHGFGSVFFEVGFYTHNFITDLLVETGLVGTAIVIFFLVKVILYELKIISEDFSNSLWLYLLVSGIIHYSFSGYYLAAVEPLWVVFMLLSRKKWIIHTAEEGHWSESIIS